MMPTITRIHYLLLFFMLLWSLAGCDAASPPTASSLPTPTTQSTNATTLQRSGGNCLQEPFSPSAPTFWCMDTPVAVKKWKRPHWLFTPDTSKLYVAWGRRESLIIGVISPDQERWEMRLAPPEGQQLSIGVYENAGSPDNSPRDYSRPAITFSGLSVTCAQQSGRFEILDLAYDYATGTVERFAATFAQQCDLQGNLVTGLIRFNSPANLAPQTPSYANVTPVPPAGGHLPIPFCPAATQGLTSPNYLCISSQAGDDNGAGRNWLWTDQQGSFGLNFAYRDRIQFTFQTADNLKIYYHWLLSFQTRTGGVLAPGLYEHAVQSAYPPDRPAELAIYPGIHIEHLALGCKEVTGRFEVLELVRNSSEPGVQRFVASFEQRCAGQKAAVFGMMRYQSPSH